MSGPAPVLVVEDDRGLLDAYRTALEPREIEVLTAATAQDALGVLREGRARAVVADVGLPDTEGPAFLARLREAAPDVPLVVLTGRSSPAVRDACERHGADRFLVKPVTGRELARVLGSLLKCAGG